MLNLFPGVSIIIGYNVRNTLSDTYFILYILKEAEFIVYIFTVTRN